ncbi:MAG: carboxymuconolactone decarboxylase family protein [Dehalococcoidia bacterium]|nr:carboxymuconolactone decarboxylase family protein [Dehalococcoidia bacterium]
MPRLSPLDLDRLTPEQQRALDEVLAGPRGAQAAPGTIPRGPIESWLRSPGLCDPAQKLGAHVRFANSLAPDLAELAIILTGAHWRAQFEFWAHARAAQRAGIADAVIEAIRDGREPQLEGHARTVYDVVTELLGTTRVSAPTYARALEAFGEQGLVDLVGTVGYYSLVSLTLNTFEVGVPEGETPPFEE